MTSSGWPGALTHPSPTIDAESGEAMGSIWKCISRPGIEPTTSHSDSDPVPQGYWDLLFLVWLGCYYLSSFTRPPHHPQTVCHIPTGYSVNPPPIQRHNQRLVAGVSAIVSAGLFRGRLSCWCCRLTERISLVPSGALGLSVFCLLVLFLQQWKHLHVWWIGNSKLTIGVYVSANGD